MAWEWSHSAEAYDAARNNLDLQDRRWLEEVYAEWHALMPDESGEPDINSFDPDQYAVALIESTDMADDDLADFIWDRMSEAATCDNGGHNAWCCPSGCHTVPFSELETSDE